ncbi:PIR protein [Plasmodium vivax]|nr:PIR protein [Plasmodium vivax]
MDITNEKYPRENEIDNPDDVKTNPDIWAIVLSFKDYTAHIIVILTIIMLVPLLFKLTPLGLLFKKKKKKNKKYMKNELQRVQEEPSELDERNYHLTYGNYER